MDSMEVEGMQHLGRYGASMGLNNKGEYVSFTTT